LNRFNYQDQLICSNTKSNNFQEITVPTASIDNIATGLDGSVLVTGNSGGKILRYKESNKLFEQVLSPSPFAEAVTSVKRWNDLYYLHNNVYSSSN
jgi:sugar lactone lactonase YvrE